MSAAMSPEELGQLPVVFDVPTAGRAWGIGRSLSFDLARRDQFPCRVVKVGRLLRVTRADLLAALGAADEGSAP